MLMKGRTQTDARTACTRAAEGAEALSPSEVPPTSEATLPSSFTHPGALVSPSQPPRSAHWI